jgi:hypothetical protein
VQPERHGGEVLRSLLGDGDQEQQAETGPMTLLARPGRVKLVDMNCQAESRGGATTAALEVRVGRMESQEAR